MDIKDKIYEIRGQYVMLDSDLAEIYQCKNGTKEINQAVKNNLEKYNMEYSNLEVRYDNTYHDRYIIIDRKIIYHLGVSINHAGSKTFSINILEDEVVKNSLYNSIFKLLTK